jgi:hypothetical protein
MTGGGTRVERRRCSFDELLWRRLGRENIFSPVAVVTWAHAGAPLTGVRATLALRAVVARHPLLRCRYVDRLGGRALWGLLPGATEMLETIPDWDTRALPLKMMPTGQGRAEVLARAEACLNGARGPGEGESPWLWEAYLWPVAADPATVQVLWFGHHGIFDAQALWLAIEDWRQALNRAEQKGEAALPARPWPPPLTAASPRLTWQNFRRALAQIGQRNTIPPQELPAVGSAPPETRRTRLAVGHWSPELMQALRQRGRQENVMVGGAIGAAVLMAVQDLLPTTWTAPLWLDVASSCRPLAGAGWQDLGAYVGFSFLSGQTVPIPPTAFWDVARQLQQEWLEAARRGDPALHLLLGRMMAFPYYRVDQLLRSYLRGDPSVVTPNGRGVTAHLTNGGQLPVWGDPGSCRPTSFHCLTGHRRFGANLSVFAVGLPTGWSVTVGGVVPLVSQAMIQQVLDGMTGALRAAAGLEARR